MPCPVIGEAFRQVDYTGTGGPGDFDNPGVALSDGAAARVADGSLTLTGDARGTVAGNEGVVIVAGTVVESTGDGLITITGTGFTSQAGTDVTVRFIDEAMGMPFAGSDFVEVPGTIISENEITGTSPTPPGVSVFAFVMDGIHPHDIATILDAHNVAVRAGHHCTQPLMRRLGVPATTRASAWVYNTTEEIDRLADALMDAQRVFGL